MYQPFSVTLKSIRVKTLDRNYNFSDGFSDDSFITIYKMDNTKLTQATKIITICKRDQGKISGSNLLIFLKSYGFRTEETVKALNWWNSSVYEQKAELEKRLQKLVCKTITL